jgi:transcriptional regulator with XRE-family HTH domain
MELTMRLANELRTRRLELRLSQAELAARLQVSQQTVSRWEHGSVTPGPRRISQLAEALRLDLAAMVRLAGYPYAGQVDAETGPISEFDHLSVQELVAHVDSAWAALRSRLLAGQARPASQLIPE